VSAAARASACAELVAALRIGDSDGAHGVGGRRDQEAGRDMRLGGVNGIHPTKEGYAFIAANTLLTRFV